MGEVTSVERVSGRLDDPPNSDVVEVNVFGPGFGESIAVHLGADRWLIVDSCCETDGGTPAAIGYLEAIGRRPEECVTYLVATHWHSDHVRGFAAEVDRCRSAFVWLTPALTYEALMTVLRLHSSKLRGGFRELAVTMDVLKEREASAGPGGATFYDYLGQSTAAHRIDRHPPGAPVEIWALSPSARDRDEAAMDIRPHIAWDAVFTRDPPRPNHNHATIVLHVRVGTQQILLGGDRETVTGSGHGWITVRDAFHARGLGKASLLKVAHHGSPNGDTPVIWNDLLEADPVAVVTPFWRGKGGGRPRRDDLIRLCRSTPTSYLTGDQPADVRARGSQPDPEDALTAASGVEEEYAEPPLAHVRLRAPIGGGGWSVQMVEPAQGACEVANASGG